MTSTPLKTSNISVIIPTLNEEENIPLLAKQFAAGDVEVIIADGGSSDKTVELAREHGFIVLTCESGRGHQQNQGALKARGELLIFLHADTRLPVDFASTVQQALAKQEHMVGAFRLEIENATLALRFISSCANLRSRLLRLPYGDQAIFIRRDNFMKLEMFPELPIMEDYLFIRKAKKYGEISIMRDSVVTSARRWQKKGVFLTTLINQVVLLGYFIGVSPEKLALIYRR